MKIKSTMPVIHASGDQLEALQGLFREAFQECEECGIDYGTITDVKINQRTTSWGRCCRQPDGTYRIELSKYLFDSDTETGLKNTILHEICHTVRNGGGHKRGWLIAAQKLNDRFGYRIKRCDTSEDKNVAPIEKPVRYILQCKSCGNQYVRMKMSQPVKYPERYHCGKCGGRLQRIQ